jgi:hypothetical protein
VWTIRKLATDNFSRERWDMADTINYVWKNAQRFLVHIQSNNNGQIIQTSEDNGASRDDKRIDGYSNNNKNENPYRGLLFNCSL